jgi:hypothetical protein
MNFHERVSPYYTFSTLTKCFTTKIIPRIAALSGTMLKEFVFLRPRASRVLVCFSSLPEPLLTRVTLSISPAGFVVFFVSVALTGATSTAAVSALTSAFGAAFLAVVFVAVAFGAAAFVVVFLAAVALELLLLFQKT